MYSLLRRARSHVVPRSSFRGQVGTLKLSNSSFGTPGRRIVTDGFREIATRALDQSQLGDAHHGRLTDVNAVSEDQSFGIDFTNSSDQLLDNLNVALLQIAFERSHCW